MDARNVVLEYDHQVDQFAVQQRRNAAVDRRDAVVRRCIQEIIRNDMPFDPDPCAVPFEDQVALGIEFIHVVQSEIEEALPVVDKNVQLHGLDKRPLLLRKRKNILAVLLGGLHCCVE